MNSKPFVRGTSPNQATLAPRALAEFLAPDHVVFAVSDLVDSLDLGAILGAYWETRGRPPYDPVLMVKILCYAYMRGIASSRQMERALVEDIGFRILACGLMPNFRTLSEFRRRHHVALGNLLVSTVQLAREAGLAAPDRDVALDGTKIKANASKHAAMSYAHMLREMDRLSREVEAYLAKIEATDRADADDTSEKARQVIRDEVAYRKARLEKIRAAKQRLEQRVREQRATQLPPPAGEKQGGAPKPTGGNGRSKRDPNVPDDKAQENFTDPESRIMVADGAFIQGYNAQAVVDAEHQIIVAADVSAMASDCPQLIDMVDQATDNLRGAPRGLLADAGYFSEENIAFLDRQGIQALIPPKRITHAAWRDMAAALPEEPPAPAQDPSHARTAQQAKKARLDAVRQRMTNSLKTPEGRTRYDRRKVSVEPTFGQIKTIQRMRQFLLRGKDKTRSMWRFACAVHNMRKLIQAGPCPNAT